MLVTGTKNKRDILHSDKLTAKSNARSAFGSTVYLKPKVTATTTTLTNYKNNNNNNNQGNKNKIKNVIQNNVNNNNNNKNNKSTKNSNNNNNNAKVLAKTKIEPHLLPTYARPTISTTARCVDATKSIAPKSLSTNIKRVQNLPKTNNIMKTVVKDRSGLDFLLPKSNAKQKNSRTIERLTGGYSSIPYTLKEKPDEYDLDLLDKKTDVSTQANDREILNYDLMVGDFKILLPSADLASTIDRERKEQRRQQELMQKRKLDANTEQRAKHLTDLKEFLESGTVTRRSVKPKPTQQSSTKRTSQKIKM